MAELMVVATPIGNLSDMTPRMAAALSGADLIAAEDTRVTMKLLNHLGISKPMISCHRHNELQQAPKLIERMLNEDITIALTCDAGTPAISDPGFELVKLAHAAGILVTPVCGPSAGIAALSASGFDAREFAFYGFLPREKKPLQQKLIEIAKGTKVAIVYESPHRVTDMVGIVADTLPDARVCVCCDISKKFERIVVAGAAAAHQQLRDNPNTHKGEYVVVIDLHDVVLEEKEAPPAALGAEQVLFSYMLEGCDVNEAGKRAMAAGLTRNEVYKAKLNIKDILG